MNSTFYADGYQDGENGRPFSPPDPVKRSDGATSNALAAEYRAGYDAGRNCKLFDAADLAGASDDSAAIQGEALTAEFSTALTRHNRRRKLRAQSGGASLWQDPEQVDLFGGGR